MYSEQAVQILTETGAHVVDRGTGPVVALAHGAGGGVVENFGPLMDAIGGYRFVGPYWPGAGGTPRAADRLELDRLADTVVAAAVARGAARFPVVGMSLGAAVAVTAARRYPEHVSALVLTVGLARADVRVRTASDAFRALAAAGAHDALSGAILSAVASDTALRSLTADEERATRTGITATMPPGMPDHMELVGRVDVTEHLPGIDVPALVVVSGGDRLVPAEISREFGAIRGARVVEYPGAGHVFTADEGARWAGDVRDFLAAL